MKKFLLFLMCLLAVTTTYAATKTITINCPGDMTGFASSGYSTNVSTTVDGFSFKFSQVIKSTDKIQVNVKKTGANGFNMYNETPIPNIQSVEFTVSSGTMGTMRMAVGDSKITGNTSSSDVTGTKSGSTVTITPKDKTKSFFHVDLYATGSGTVYVSKIVITYDEADTPKALGDLAVTYGDNQSVADDGSASVPEGTVFNFKAENATSLKVTDVNDNVIAEGTDAAAWTAVRGEYILTATATGVDATGAAATKSIAFELSVEAPQPKDYAPEFSGLSVAVGSTLALAPTADNASGADAPAITYAIKSGDVLTLSGSTVTGVKVGSATITASWTAVPDKWNAGSKDFTVSVTEKPKDEIWTLVTSISDLKAGDKYIMVYGTKAMSTEVVEKYRNTAEVKITDGNLVNPSENVLRLELETVTASNNAINYLWKGLNYLSNVENPYLYALSSDNALYLAKPQTEANRNTSVALDENTGDAKILFVNVKTSNKPRQLFYADKLGNFRTYAEDATTNNAAKVKIYKLGAKVETECAAPVFDPVAGDVRRGQVINFTTTTAGASVYYTVNDGGAQYGTSYTIPADAADGSLYEIRATATKDGLADATNSATYTVRVPQLGAITFDPADGSTIEQGTRVLVTAENATAITYVLNVNGRDRQEQSLDESGSIAILDYGTVKVSVTAQGEGGPKTAEATYTVTQKFPGTPEFSVADGSAVVSGTEVTVKVPDAGVIIITPYLIDGSLGAPRRVQTHNSQDGTTFTVDKWNRRFKVQGSLYGNLGQEAEAFYSLKTVEQPAGDVYELITDKSQLTDGIEVLFVGYKDGNPYVMTSDIIESTNNSFNVAVAECVKSGDHSKITAIPENANTIYMTKVEGAEDQWFLYAEGNYGYLYASNTGNNSNGMSYKELNTKCNATISFTNGSGAVSFDFTEFDKDQVNTILKFNNNSVRFSCYKANSGNTTTFNLYKKAASTPGTETPEACDYPITVNHGTYEPWEEHQPAAAPAREAAATGSAEMDAQTSDDGTITYTARLNNMAGLFSLNLEGENGSLMGHRTDAVACDETCTEHPKHVYVQPGESYNLVHSANENAVQLSTIDLHNVYGNGYKTADLTVTLDPFRSATMSLAGDSQELTGVTDVAVDNAAAPVEYYDLQGRRIDAPAAGSVVIRRQGADVRKIHIR